MKLRCILFFVSSVLLVTTSYAADKTGKYAIKGIGNSSCSQFITETKSNSNHAYLYIGWMNGYITTQNQYISENFDLTSWENIYTLGDYVRSYCKNNPRHSFYVATANMVNALKKDRVNEFSRAIKIGVNQESILIYESTLKKIQKKLKTLGMYSGNIDGQYGKGTAKAIKAFQKTHKLETTGIPNQITLHAFFRK